MNIKKEVRQSQLFDKRYGELLYFFSTNAQRRLRVLKFHYWKTYRQLLKEFPPGFVKSEMKLKIRRRLKYFNHREPVGILVDTLDRGGLEQVVYNLCTGFKQIKPYIFITGKEYGNMGWKLRQEGFYVYTLDDNIGKFFKLAEDINIKKINAHYSIWNFKEISQKGIQIFYTIHNSYTWLDGEDLKLRKKAYTKVFKFIAVSSSVKKYFRKKFGISPQKIFTIPNGFDLEKWKHFRIADSSRKVRKRFVFLNVASFTPLKNQVLLVNAFMKINKKYPDANLYLVGNILDVDYYKKVVSLIKKLNLTKNVKIYDFMPQTKLFGIYQKADCFVLCSLQEGAPNVLLESMYMELPTISTDVGNAKELLSNYGIVIKNSYDDLTKLDINDLVVIANDNKQLNTEELTQSMENIIENFDMFKKKAKASSSHIKKFFRKENQVKKYEKLILLKE